METNNNLVQRELGTEEKLTAYIAAKNLYNQGYSHPQIVEIFSKALNPKGALLIADKAFSEEWDKLHFRAANMFAEGKIRSEIVEELLKQETDDSIVNYLVDDLYNRNIDVINNNIEAKRKSSVWAYMIAVGLIQVVRYFVDPYNKYVFYAFALVMLAGLIWGIKELFFKKKDKVVLSRHLFFEVYKNQWKKEQSQIYSQEKKSGL